MQKAETLTNGTVVYTSENHPITTDSLLLADFITANCFNEMWSVCDLGSGCGILLLTLVDRGLMGHAVGIESDLEGSGLLRNAISTGELINVQAVMADLREYQTPFHYDLVIANPPYYNAGPLPPDDVRAAARHEVDCTLNDICAAAFRLLKDGGNFVLCYPPARLADLFSALQLHFLAPKQMQFVRKTPADEPWLAMVAARKKGGAGMHILPDLILEHGGAKPTV